MDHPKDASLNELVEAYVRMWDARSESSLVDEVMAPDVVDHQPVGPADGVEAVRRDIAMYHAAYSDLALSCEDYILGEDRVAVRWGATGTHDGDGLGMPPTTAEWSCVGSTSCASRGAAWRNVGASSTAST